MMTTNCSKKKSYIGVLYKWSWELRREETHHTYVTIHTTWTCTTSIHPSIVMNKNFYYQRVSVSQFQKGVARYMKYVHYDLIACTYAHTHL